VSDTPLPDALATVPDSDGDADALADRLADADPETTKASADELRTVADDDPAALSALQPAVEVLLTAEDRSVRLTVTKAVGEFAAADPDGAASLVPALTERLDDEFYFVRGRAAEALGHVARHEPDAIETATVVARLLNALSLDRAETRQHVAGALANVALGDPRALRTVTDDVADALADDDPLVRYHLSTALVAVAAAHPSYCKAVTEAVAAQLDDDCVYVRGRAAELLGLVAASDDAAVTDNEEALDACANDVAFVAERARFALGGSDRKVDAPDSVADLAAIADATADIVDDITTPDGEGCPHCGESVGGGAPPFCPACGAPLPPS
jgi:hypothetical protein